MASYNRDRIRIQTTLSAFLKVLCGSSALGLVSPKNGLIIAAGCLIVFGSLVAFANWSYFQKASKNDVKRSSLGSFWIYIIGIGACGITAVRMDWAVAPLLLGIALVVAAVIEVSIWVWVGVGKADESNAI